LVLLAVPAVLAARIALDQRRQLAVGTAFASVGVTLAILLVHALRQLSLGHARSARPHRARGVRGGPSRQLRGDRSRTGLWEERMTRGYVIGPEDGLPGPSPE
jgi:hypothetical protein